MQTKQVFALLLVLALLCGSLTGCASARQTAPAEPTVPFTDSLGRTVEIPETLTRVAPSGAVASMFLATIAPEYMATINATPSSSQYKYLDPRLIDLPTTGQMYGSKSTLNLESILTSGAQVVIDLGDKKDNMAADLDALQKQIGMPVIFIEADLPHMAEAYRTLGKILSGKEARGEELAAFVDETVSLAEENAAKIQDSERISVLYTSGSSGLNTNAKGSIQAQVLDLMGIENAAVVEDVSNKGGGNPINLEQLYRFDPDVILFTADSTYSTAADDEAWQPLRAIEAGRYYEIPSMPYNWLSNPPSLNMLLGVWWLGNLLYPQYYAYDMVEKTQEMFRLLWNYDLTAEGSVMKRLLTRGALLLLLCALLAASGFADVKAEAVCQQDVLFCTDEGLMTGTGRNTFSPDRPMTRAMVVATLYRLAGSPEVTEKAAFTDVASGSYYEAAILNRFTASQSEKA